MDRAAGIMSVGVRSAWPELEYANWVKTRQTLHRWTQIIGKIRLARSPWLNHSWHVPLYVSERGLATSVIHHEELAFSMELDFVAHCLRIRVSDGKSAELPLRSEPVAAFYRTLMEALRGLGVPTEIYARPNEMPDALPFEQDEIHREYDPEYAHRFWRALLESDRLMKIFRSRFEGKASPVHFFWGSFDLAVTRFSGRRAPPHPGGVPHLPDVVARESYSHEVSSCGFWPGDERLPMPAFYSYAYPQPEGFATAPMPEGVTYNEALRELILPYSVVREAKDPERLVLDFFEKSYEAAASLGRWDSEVLGLSPYLRELQGKRRIN